ncbi:MAG TPA: alginate lyase family protein, partial [Balneolaceae bacterium]|nr:alginate lyase family protein [Balneolaceae bacterium]
MMTNRSAIPGNYPNNLNALVNEKPDLIRGLFNDLNLDYPGLADVKNLVKKEKWIAACKALVDYYKNKSKSEYPWLQKVNTENGKQEIKSANEVLNNVFTFQGVKGKQPSHDDGSLNWKNLGPREDKEWGYFLNRQSYFNDLLYAHNHTNKSVYSQKFNNLLTDWVYNNPAPGKEVQTVTWRQLEVGLRLTTNHWPRAFYGFQSAPQFSDVARILMLSSIPKQADYILNYHRMHSNWASMELNGLAATAFYWPEFKHAQEWLNHARQKMEEEVRYEVYPDGAQNELTSHYHEVALRNFEAFYDLNRKNDESVPSFIRNTIVKMYDYLAFTMRPNGYGLLNNDSNLDYNRDFIRGAAGKYDHPEWAYIASNGNEGVKPKQGPSVFFPWAGHMVMRSGWDPDARWSFFDVGPWGNHHQHNDKLQLSVASFGHDWLVDAGRYYYKWDKWRLYFVSSRSHNVILVDGKGQLPYKELAEKPIKNNYSIQPGFDFCLGSYNKGFGSNWWKSDKNERERIPAKHQRAVLFLYKRYWVVVDHISTKQSREIEPLWHISPKVKVTRNHTTVVATDSLKNQFQLIPAEPDRWKLDMIKGMKGNHIQGWYSQKYNSKVPNYCATYHTTQKDTSSTFAWVLYPSQKVKQKVNVEVLPAPDGA